MASPPGLVVSGVWQHVALAYDKASGLATIFLNGVVAAQTNLGSFAPQTTFNLVLGARTTFGSASAPADRFWGMLDELSLYNRALTVSEVLRIYNAGQAGKCLSSPTAEEAIESLRAAVMAEAPRPTPLLSSLSAALEKKDKSATIRKCLMGLSAEHREIVDLVYYHEKSVEEVAEIVGIPMNTVKTRMFYARKRLAELLKAGGIERGWP